MAIGNINPAEKVGVTAPEAEASATNAVSANNVNNAASAEKTSPADSMVLTHENDKMFAQMADLTTKTLDLTGEKNQALIDKKVEGRVVDLSDYVSSMRTAKLNLMPSGNMILSMYNGEQMFNHQMTPKERSFMADVLDNPNLEDSQKLGKVTSMVSSIAMNTQLSYSFDKSISQGESVAMHR